MKLGGAHKLASRLGGEPLGMPLDHVFRQMKTELAALQGSVVRSVQIVQGSLRDEEVIRQGLQGGAPGYLLGYLGGTYEAFTNDGAHLDRNVSLGVLCISDSLYGHDDRVAGITPYRPSLFALMGWAAFYGGRALHRMPAFGGTGRPVSEEILGAGGEYALGLVTFEGRLDFDLLNDQPYGVLLEKAGIVHTPKANEPLFEADNLTPNTDDPTSLPGPGVANLVE